TCTPILDAGYDTGRRRLTSTGPLLRGIGVARRHAEGARANDRSRDSWGERVPTWGRQCAARDRLALRRAISGAEWRAESHPATGSDRGPHRTGGDRSRDRGHAPHQPVDRAQACAERAAPAE